MANEGEEVVNKGVQAAIAMSGPQAWPEDS